MYLWVFSCLILPPPPPPPDRVWWVSLWLTLSCWDDYLAWVQFVRSSVHLCSVIWWWCMRCRCNCIWMVNSLMTSRNFGLSHKCSDSFGGLLFFLLGFVCGVIGVYWWIHRLICFDLEGCAIDWPSFQVYCGWLQIPIRCGGSTPQFIGRFLLCLCCSEIAMVREWSPLDFIYWPLDILLSVVKVLCVVWLVYFEKWHFKNGL